MTITPTFPELVAGPLAGQAAPPPEAGTRIRYKYPAGAAEHSTDTVVYVREPLVLAGAAVNVWIADTGSLDDAVVAIVKRACQPSRSPEHDRDARTALRNALLTVRRILEGTTYASIAHMEDAVVPHPAARDLGRALNVTILALEGDSEDA